AVEGVWFRADGGAYTVRLGPTGAAKTTLFNLITRLFATRSGRIAICGIDVARRPRAALARIGVVFQSRAIDPHLSVGQNLLYQGALHGLTPREASRRGAALLDRMGLIDRRRDPVGALSGGEARRVEIARALLHGPRLLLCDEASAGLDLNARTRLLADLRALAAADGVALLWATHLFDEVQDDDPVTILAKGVVRAQGPASSIAGSAALADAYLALTGGEPG
ncbi:MAG: ATP-binding cassette domain-containing protein, partial [Pseudomonadota bacterium]